MKILRYSWSTWILNRRPFAGRHRFAVASILFVALYSENIDIYVFLLLDVDKQHALN